MLSKLKLVLFLVALVSQCEAGIAPIRFGRIHCGHRLHQATLGLAPVNAVIEESVSRYLDGAYSFFDLGKRFTALSTGNFRAHYPDLAYIATMMAHADNGRVGRNSAFHVGITKLWIQAVERPVRSWVVRTYYNRMEFEQPNALLQYEIVHTDGSKSFVYSYREGAPKFDERGRDRRELVNVFVYSNGPEIPATVIHAVAGDPLHGPSIIATARETQPYLAEITATLDGLDQRVNVEGSHILTAPATAVLVTQD